MEWININTELPECWSQHGKDFASGYVLGFTNYKECVITQLYKISNENEYSYKWCNIDDDEYITHWMHLPKFPKND